MRTRLLVPVSLLAVFVACAAARGPGVLYEGDSPYSHLIVDQDESGVRRLYFEKRGATQSAIKPGAPLELILPYTRASMIALVVAPKPKKALFVGLGGGAMPMFLRALHPEVEIEAVEIDPGVVKLARTYFGFKEDKRLKVHVGDGRAFVEKAKGGWDLVFLDAYGSESIPRHLATLEFLQTLRGKLASGGLVVGNVWEPDSNPLYASMARTYAEAFGGLCVLEVPASGNRIFLAHRPVPSVDELFAGAAKLTAERNLPFELSIYARGGCVQELDPAAPLLRDPKP